ncbi:histidine kinase [Massilia yuzhufengensis]|uniref:histidine kinase n=1 Tax=Massilia yuzhufengensis TaxID=1164594 RepID=A0A1I1LNK3_9BURK|nr:histidine kinase [Massilia yuzhufengensis]SFC71040.1 Histidine kinase-, DNA gyrase B-, and HSP90-like ATPase [Massilia yuzhufengensis]
MTSFVSEAKSSLLSILVLTGLVLAALTGTVVAGFALIFDLSPQTWHVAYGGLGGFLALLAVQLVYLGFAAQLVRKRSASRMLVRYALALQMQALAEMLMVALTVAAVTGGVVVLIGLLGDHRTQAELIAWFLDPNTRVTALMFVLMLPALTMLLGAWRLHALRAAPGAVLAAADGSLVQRTLAVAADSADLRHALSALVERLTDRSMPGLGRLWYTAHPRLRVSEAEGRPEYELVWTNCPMKLLVSLRPDGEGGQQVVARSVLRGGWHRVELFATPLDALAQVQYIETHLLAPLRDQLAKVSAERQRDALREHAVETQLRILQAQIEPHFLFNTLANVRHLYRSSVSAGEDMMDHLIAYLRSAMDDLRAEDSTVVRELDLAMHYLAIMKIRMGERLSYRFVLPDTLKDHAFPPAMLISLVENAVKHGLASAEKGEIALSAAASGSQLRLTVSDNGSGLSSVGGTGVGLSNIRQRLEAMFGSAAWLEVGAEPGAGFTATIVIPLNERKH